MNFSAPTLRFTALMRALPIALVSFQAALGEEPLQITEPPASFFEKVRERDREAARAFYRKYLDIGGMPVVASQEIADEALYRTHELVTGMLAGRPDVLNELAGSGMYLIIIGRHQVYTDMPENRNVRNPDYFNERVRGTGGKPTSFGEENLLSLPVDRYDDESIAVHEFAHTIDFSLRRMDPEWLELLDSTYQAAMRKGLFRDTYAATNVAEYWAESVQIFFGCNRVNNWNHGPIGTREQLRTYDPDGYELLRKTFNLAPDQNWQYQWLQPLPTISTPPDQFDVPAYYTKFTYARELPVIGRGASDEALLKANDTVRRMFAYRHDILKEFINRGAKLVVLGPDESIAGLPEADALFSMGDVDPLCRVLPFHEPTALMVVDADSVMGDPSVLGDHPLISILASAIHTVAGTRPVDPEFEGRRDVQQYELRVKRIDETFSARLEELFEKASDSGLWRGTSAIHDPSRYWTRGVMCYFDAAGPDAAPEGLEHPVLTRAELDAYDPDLAAFVRETMAFTGRSDWRFTPSPVAP